jgi:hypothetical protein
MFKKMIKKSALVSFLLLGLSGVANAQAIVSSTSVDEVGVINITSVGVQSLPGAVLPFTENIVFFRRDGGWQAGCSFGVMYFDPTTTIGRNFYAMLLTARAAGLPLDRVSYTANTLDNNQIICVVDQILSVQ